MNDVFSRLPTLACHKIDMRHEDVLFRQGQPTSGLFRIISGRVTLRRHGENGEVLTLHHAAAGGSFAEASIFSETYHCDAICTAAGSVEKLDKVAVVKLMEADADFSLAFTRHLALQVQHYRAHIEMLSIRSAKERIMVAVQAGYLEASAMELASRINLSHEACYRALTALCNEGRMRRTGRGQYELA
ncbi:hypothetical protein ROLI_030360 [Roseobacter fucihabitans]|uniref:Cyclic nucleotide-binding domain-containing protein n=1 Tax=Roseobacter fucihabitans TaxID=1537242 RepID=A0ABZ2BVW0_9RHOB|nr:Crp/Fnr family transcriptional regulator [Roseobacter litoralis]MBC6967193.1 Cyclic nucleotide-binding domain protein [Roseobacter litoralis]MBC6967888.1 Cyclic nucleotide-binding domain protein [Roseobacter litoralis]